MSKKIKILVGFVIAGFCLWLSFRGISFSEVKMALASAHWGWFFPTLLCTITGHTLRAFRWRVLLSPIQRIAAHKLFMMLTLGFFMNNILPARAGEIVRAYALHKQTAIPVSSGIGSIALERLSDLIGLVFVLFVASAVLPKDQVPITKVLGILGVGCVLIAVLFILFQRRNPKENRPGGLISWTLEFMNKLTAGFIALKSPTKIMTVALLSIVIWSTEILNVLLMANVFSIHLSPIQAAAVLMGIAVGVMIPGAPGYVGTYEYFGKRMMLFLGFAETISLSFILTLHVFQLVINSLLGLPGFFKMGNGSNSK